MKKLNERVASLEAIIPSIHETLQKLDERMEGMDHVIRGNGGPGLTQRVGILEDGVKTKESNHSMVVNALYGAVGGLVVGLIVLLCQTYVSKFNEPKSVSPVQSISRNH
jgi:NADPH-dependent curcumin reductase CurA